MFLHLASPFSGRKCARHVLPSGLLFSTNLSWQNLVLVSPREGWHLGKEKRVEHGAARVSWRRCKKTCALRNKKSNQTVEWSPRPQRNKVEAEADRDRAKGRARAVNLFEGIFITAIGGGGRGTDGQTRTRTAMPQRERERERERGSCPPERCSD